MSQLVEILLSRKTFDAENTCCLSYPVVTQTNYPSWASDFHSKAQLLVSKHQANIKQKSGALSTAFSLCINVLNHRTFDSCLKVHPGLLLIELLGTNFTHISTKLVISYNKMGLQMLSVKWQLCCVGLSMLTHIPLVPHIYVSELGHHCFR